MRWVERFLTEYREREMIRNAIIQADVMKERGYQAEDHVLGLAPMPDPSNKQRVMVA